MEPDVVLAEFTEQLRRNPVAEPGSRVEHDEHVTRVVSAGDGWSGVLWSDLADLTEAGADAVIAAQVRRFAAVGHEWEWKHYSYDRPAGLPRRLAAMTVPFADLRAAAKSVDSSLNDAFLAAVTGGLRRYHEAHGVDVDELTIAFPVSTREASDPMGGNRFSGARIAAPVGVADPVERMAIIRRRARAVRDEPALDFLSAVAPLMARIPGPALTRLTSMVTRSIDLQASNIPGLDRPAYIAGARITAMFPFGPVPGPAVMVTLISHDGTCCIGVTMDAVAVPDPGRFLDCLREGFDEVLGLVDRAVPPADAVLGRPDTDAARQIPTRSET